MLLRLAAERTPVQRARPYADRRSSNTPPGPCRKTAPGDPAHSRRSEIGQSRPRETRSRLRRCSGRPERSRTGAETRGTARPGREPSAHTRRTDDACVRGREARATRARPRAARRSGGFIQRQLSSVRFLRTRRDPRIAEFATMSSRGTDSRGPHSSIPLPVIARPPGHHPGAGEEPHVRTRPRHRRAADELRRGEPAHARSVRSQRLTNMTMAGTLT